MVKTVLLASMAIGLSSTWLVASRNDGPALTAPVAAKTACCDKGCANCANCTDGKCADCCGTACTTCTEATKVACCDEPKEGS